VLDKRLLYVTPVPNLAGGTVFLNQSTF